MYNSYYLQVYSYVMTIVKNQSLAEEITQNTFYKAMTAKHTYEGKSSEFTWLGSSAYLRMLVENLYRVYYNDFICF